MGGVSRAGNNDENGNFVGKDNNDDNDNDDDIENTQGKGRGLVATRTIRPRETILVER